MMPGDASGFDDSTTPEKLADTSRQYQEMTAPKIEEAEKAVEEAEEEQS
jgi:hypothetical protein